MSWREVEKYSQRPSRDQPSSCSEASSHVSRAQLAAGEVEHVDVAVARCASRRTPAAGRRASTAGATRCAGCDTSSRASPPAAGTVQMSPPETKAISAPSGETAGSLNAGCGAAFGACAVRARAMVRARQSATSVLRMESPSSADQQLAVGSWHLAFSTWPRACRVRPSRSVLRAVAAGAPMHLRDFGIQIR